ncbi:MAG: HD domain-containing protein [Proteobacteria bacterium]|nr:HD domain-containing protein [Pseudomonadota bacterium]MBU1739174.1 HD domain-containing protein [Pseudomonadota bacterium]
MNGEQYREFARWFTSYVCSFRESDPDHQRNLDLKEQHTARVGMNMERITRKLGLSANDQRLAAAIALFHDLGRFPQYRLYRTFRDAISENHAKLAIRELTRHRILHTLDPAERRLVGRAIIYHNRFHLPTHLDPQTLLHSRLIRDADKLDILRLMAEEFRKPKALQNPVVTFSLAQESAVRDEIYQHLFAQRPMTYEELTNANEFKVLQMSWAFTLNFRPSFEIMRERDDLDVIAASLPDSSLRDKALAFVKTYIDRRIADDPG